MKERYKLLVLSSFILFAFYYAYDIPSALNHHIISEKNESSNERKIMMLYSAYAFPNIIVPIFFSWISMLKKTLLAKILCSLVLLGHGIFTVGVCWNNFKIMLLGRFIFGLGGESFAVIQNKLISYEFNGKELSFAMGLFSSIARLGTISNFIITPILATAMGKVAPCMVGFLLTAMGLGVCFKINSSKRAHDLLKQKLIGIQKGTNQEDVSMFVGNKADSPHKTNLFYTSTESLSIFTQESGSQTSTPLLSNDNPFLQEYNSNKQRNNSPQVKTINPVLTENPFSPWKKEKRTINLKEKLTKNSPKKFFEENGTIFYEPSLEGNSYYRLAFVILVSISFMFATVWAPFYNIGPMLLQKRYGISSITSSNMFAMIEGMSLIFILVTGTISDKYGYKLWLVTFGGIFLLFGHLSILFKVGPIYLPITMLGFAGPLISCYWPCIPSLVSEEFLVTGFSIIYCALNLAFTFSPLVVSYFVQNDTSYNGVEVYMVVLTVMALFSTLSLLYVNKKDSLGLNDKVMMDSNTPDI